MSDYPVKVVGRNLDLAAIGDINTIPWPEPDPVSLSQKEMFALSAYKSLHQHAPTEPTDAVVALVRAVQAMKEAEGHAKKGDHQAWSQAITDAFNAHNRLRTVCPELVRMAEGEKGDA